MYSNVTRMQIHVRIAGMMPLLSYIYIPNASRSFVKVA